MFVLQSSTPPISCSLFWISDFQFTCHHHSHSKYYRAWFDPLEASWACLGDRLGILLQSRSLEQQILGLEKGIYLSWHCLRSWWGQHHTHQWLAETSPRGLHLESSCPLSSGSGCCLGFLTKALWTVAVLQSKSHFLQIIDEQVQEKVRLNASESKLEDSISFQRHSPC